MFDSIVLHECLEFTACKLSSVVRNEYLGQTVSGENTSQFVNSSGGSCG